MIEFEKKILLTAMEYGTLFAALTLQGKISTQINHYYDTADLSGNKNGITYRIREKGTQFQATIKQHHLRGTDDSCEISGNVSNAHDISFFNIPALLYQGTLTTQRLRVKMDENIELALDKNIYLGHCDYELEMEYAKGFEELVLIYLNELDELLGQHTRSPLVKRVNMSASKSERFFCRKSFLERNYIL